MSKSYSDWEINVNRPQRAEARKQALKLYPQQAIEKVWGKGMENEHTYNDYVDHPKYQTEYFKQLRIVRAKRFL